MAPLLPSRAPRSRRGPACASLARAATPDASRPLARLALLALGVLLLLAAGARAGEPGGGPPVVTGPQSAKTLGKAVKAGLAEHRAGIRDALVVLRFGLDGIEHDLDDGGLTAEQLADALGAALEDFVRTCTGWGFAAHASIDAAAVGLLDQLEPGDGEDAMPPDFEVGGGGPLDAGAERLRRTIDAANRRANNLVQGFARRVEQSTTLAVNAVVQATQDAQPIAPIAGGAPLPPVKFPYALEVLVAVSDREVDDDGILLVAALVPGDLGEEVAVLLVGAGGLTVHGPYALDDAARFRALVSTSGSPLSEGGYKVVVDFNAVQVARSITIP